jgi:tape measure domain-containing protein
MAVKIGDVTIRIGATTKQLEADLRKAERALQATSRKFTNIGQSLTLGLTVPMLGLGAAATSSFAEIERLQNSLTAVMGDAKAAGEEFERLRKVAEAPGLALPQVVSASAKLQAVGLSAEEARDTISQYGNAVARSGGQAQEFDGAILALTQIASKGKISAEELNQLGERIFEIRPALEAAFGTSNSEELQKLGISAEEFIAKTTAELAKLQRVEGGLSNAFENFRDNITSALSTLGDSISSAIDLPSLLDRISRAVAKVGEFFKNLSPEAQKAIVYFGLFAAAIGPLLIIFGKLSLAIGTIRIAMVGLQVAFTQGGLLAAFSFLGGPAIAGVVALAAAAYLLYKNWEIVKKSLVDVVNYFIDLYNESTLFRAAINSIVLAFKGFVNAGQLAISLVINAFKALFKFILDGFVASGKLIKAVLTLDVEAIPGIIKEGFSAFGNIGDFIKNSAQDIKVFGVQTSVDLANAVNDTLRKKIKPITGADLFGGGAAGVATGTTSAIIPTATKKPTISPELAKELAKISEELLKLEKLYKAGLIDATDLANERITLLTKKLELLVTNGFSPTSDAVKNLKSELSKLRSTPALEILPQASGIQSLETVVSGLQQRITGGVTTASAAVSSILKNTSTTVRDYYVGIGAGFVDAQGKFKAFAEEVSAVSIDVGQQLSQAFGSSLEAVGVLIGNLVSGEGAGSLKVFFNSILTVILDFAIGLGKQLIALGTATESLKKLFTNPVGAIIAGVGLIAVATIVKGIISKGVPSLAIGTDYVKQDGLAILHKGEAVVPADVVGGGFKGGGGTQIYGRLSGIDLLLSNQYATGYQKRLR